MARQARLFVEGYPQLLRLAVAPGRSAFFSRLAYETFLCHMYTLAPRFAVSVHAHALMPDQALLLVSCPLAKGVGAWVQAINRVFVPWVLQQTGQSAGAVWVPRFKSTVVQPGAWELASCLWVDTAPQWAGISQESVTYPWSSFAAHTGVAIDRELTDLPQYWALGNTPFERQVRYREFSDRGLPDRQVQVIAYGLDKGWAIADEQIVKTGELASNRPAAPRPRGRPRVSRKMP